MSFSSLFSCVRPHTLFIGAGPVLLGFFLSLSDKHSPLWLLNAITVFCVLCIQIATHFFNDALDFTKGADTALRQGPKRAVQKGELSVKFVLRAGFFTLALATLFGSFLVLKGGWPILLIGIFSLALAYLYTGGPYPLAYTGVSDLFVLLFFGILPCVFVFYLHTGQWSLDSFVAGSQCGLLALGPLVANHLRDVREDSFAQKKTLVVRWGMPFGIVEWSFAHYLPYLLGLIYWSVKDQIFMASLPLILIPLSFFMHRLLFKALKNPLAYKTLLGFSCLYHFLFVFLLCLSTVEENFDF